MTSDRLRKARVFLGVGEPYWRRYARPAGARASNATTGLAPYPLDFASHVRAGHYALRDADGLPISRWRSGAAVRNYTRLCGFALGQLQAYEATNAEHCLADAIGVARYLQDSAQPGPKGSLLLRADVPGRGHIGPISAMSQGMALSVLARIAEITGDQEARQRANALAAPFQEEAGPVGVRTVMCPKGCSWFEEDTARPLRHILNGMIFAVWGLRDLSVAGDSAATGHHGAGIAALVHHAADFDAGWWSWYHVSKEAGPRLASGHYHQLHACQLAALGEEDAAELVPLATRFEQQLRSPVSRFRAAIVTLAQPRA